VCVRTEEKPKQVPEDNFWIKAQRPYLTRWLCQIGDTATIEPGTFGHRRKPPDFDSACKIQDSGNRGFPF
jgi:hypothetical protein